MSLFNTLKAKVPCPRCSRIALQEVQFKYGECRQHELTLGDEIPWSGDYPEEDWGDPSQVSVVVEGIAGPCPGCKEQFLYYDIFVKSGILRDVTPHNPRYCFNEVRPESNIIVLGCE